MFLICALQPESVCPCACTLVCGAVLWGEIVSKWAPTAGLLALQTQPGGLSPHPPLLPPTPTPTYLSLLHTAIHLPSYPKASHPSALIFFFCWGGAATHLLRYFHSYSSFPLLPTLCLLLHTQRAIPEWVNRVNWGWPPRVSRGHALFSCQSHMKADWLIALLSTSKRLPCAAVIALSCMGAHTQMLSAHTHMQARPYVVVDTHS